MLPEDQFLIAVPTRNREETALTSLTALLPLAAMEDIQVVVSDNSDDPSRKLQNFCRANDIGYVRPPEVLSMTAHWDWILSELEYRAITILTDRSWLLADTYLEAKRIAEATGHAVTSDAAALNLKKKLGIEIGVLSAEVKTGRRFDIPIDKLRDHLSERLSDPALPRLMNAIVFRKEVDAVRAKFGGKLSSASPDYEFSYKYLYSFSGKKLSFLDKVMFFTHSKQLSNSGGLDSGRLNSASLDFEKLNKLKRYDHSPEPDAMDSMSVIAHELNKICHELGLPRFVDGDDLKRQRETWKFRKKTFPKRQINSIRALLGIHDATLLKVTSGSDLGSIDSNDFRVNPKRRRPYDEWTAFDRVAN